MDLIVPFVDCLKRIMVGTQRLAACHSRIHHYLMLCSVKQLYNYNGHNWVKYLILPFVFSEFYKCFQNPSITIKIMAIDVFNPEVSIVLKVADSTIVLYQFFFFYVKVTNIFYSNQVTVEQQA